jgi:hypothetical protein
MVFGRRATAGQLPTGDEDLLRLSYAYLIVRLVS